MNIHGDKLSGIKADILIHTAAIWLLPSVIDAIIKTGVERIIAFGSTSVFGKTNSKNMYEQQVVKKLENAEHSILSKSDLLNITIFRPTMIYGMGMDANITRMTNTIRKFGFVAIYPPAKGLRHPVWAKDLADAAISIIDNPKTYGKAYNLGGKTPITYHEMVKKIFIYLGKKPCIIGVPFLPFLLNIMGKLFPFIHINGEVATRMNQDLVFDMSSAKEDFDYHPHNFLEGDIIL